MTAGRESGTDAGTLHHRTGRCAACVILGWVVGLLKVPKPIASRSLYVVALIEAVIVLYICIPAPHFRADIVDAEISRCVDPESLREATVDRLNQTAASRPPLNKPIRL